MNLRFLCAGLAISMCACVSPRNPPASAATPTVGIEKDIAEARAALRALDKKLYELEVKITSTSAEDEFTVMTIDGIGDNAISPSLRQQDSSNIVLLHVAEWRGFGKMKRFTQLADPEFSLVADGHPTLIANTGVGGVSNEDGSTRFVMLSLRGSPVPGVRYELRPRNQREGYKWVVAPGVSVTVK